MDDEIVGEIQLVHVVEDECLSSCQAEATGLEIPIVGVDHADAVLEQNGRDVGVRDEIAANGYLARHVPVSVLLVEGRHSGWLLFGRGRNGVPAGPAQPAGTPGTPRTP